MPKRTRESIAPDITPLIDVVFLLLIFFMVSTVFKKDELALILSLPKTQEGQGAKTIDKTFYIEMGEKSFAVNGKKIEFEAIDTELATITKKDRPIEIRIDKSVIYDRVVKLLDKLKQYDLNNLALVTEK